MQGTEFGHLKVHGSLPVRCVGGRDGLFVGDWLAVHELDFLGSVVDCSVKCMCEGRADFRLIVERRVGKDVLKRFMGENFLVVVVVEDRVGVGRIVVTGDLAVM